MIPFIWHSPKDKVTVIANRPGASELGEGRCATKEREHKGFSCSDGAVQYPACDDSSQIHTHIKMCRVVYQKCQFNLCYLNK